MVIDFYVFGGWRMSRIKSVTPLDGFRLEIMLDNGSEIILNLESRLHTVRFGILSDKDFFKKAVKVPLIFQIYQKLPGILQPHLTY
jgi:Protein of unknown function (DUF2442).